MGRTVRLKLFPSQGGFIDQRGRQFSKRALLDQLMAYAKGETNISIRRAPNKPTPRKKRGHRK